MVKMGPEQRKADVVEAVWRVVRRDGLPAASVRNVAQEAGLSMGSLRHYFASQAELLSFTLCAVIERIEARIAALPSEPDPRRRAERVLLELLPLDPERAAENEVWLAFTARAQVDPKLRAVHDRGYDVLRSGCRRLVEGLAGQVTGLDVELETDRLHTLLDGLAVHIAMRPDALTPDRARLIVARHLDELIR
ncbi:TetR family transcriptional regulator C-terminal domain-containing protein [Actinomadura sp. NPDC048394]|jgi:AcrR family transcriptional regulator|uniref:TetR/AcrR family transcriptional regulator n=1 Tax=Actinomadura sp. NPDC048394 TaxID=3158223 RepID=UPI0033CB04DC